MFSRRSFLRTLGLAAAGTAGALRASTPADLDAPPDVIAQRTIGEMACGPCAVANAVANGDAACRRGFASLDGGTPLERVWTIIREYGALPSETYRGRRLRYSEKDGTTSEDMPFLANDLLQSLNLGRVAGRWLDVQAGEPGRVHLRRLHDLFSDALAAGLPPIVEVRSFGANTAAPKGPEWNGLQGHWMSVLALEPRALPARATGFVCRCADSSSGMVVNVFAYAELHRPFTATRGFTALEDGSRKWNWISGYPYILVEAPELALNTQKSLWHERTFMSLNYAVCRTA